MKRIKTFTLAATILTLTLAAFPRHASAAVNAYLIIDGRPSVSTAYIVSFLLSALLP